jgi:hypothetical protein
MSSVANKGRPNAMGRLRAVFLFDASNPRRAVAFPRSNPPSIDNLPSGWPEPRSPPASASSGCRNFWGQEPCLFGRCGDRRFRMQHRNRVGFRQTEQHGSDHRIGQRNGRRYAEPTADADRLANSHAIAMHPPVVGGFAWQQSRRSKAETGRLRQTAQLACIQYSNGARILSRLLSAQ